MIDTPALMVTYGFLWTVKCIVVQTAGSQDCNSNEQQSKSGHLNAMARMDISTALLLSMNFGTESFKQTSQLAAVLFVNNRHAAHAFQRLHKQGFHDCKMHSAWYLKALLALLPKPRQPALLWQIRHVAHT